MNASEVHGRLSKDIHDEVAAARQRGALTWEELDRILAAFDVSDYDAQLEALVIELETLPLRRPAMPQRPARCSQSPWDWHRAAKSRRRQRSLARRRTHRR